MEQLPLERPNKVTSKQRFFSLMIVEKPKNTPLTLEEPSHLVTT